MLHFSCLVTGDDYQMVKKETPASKKKIVSLVSALFIPVTMWIINVVLVALQVLESSLTAAILSGLIAGMLIFFIERNIIMSNGSKVIMAFRIFLGLIIALLGSLAFDEIIFKNDIDQKLAKNKIELVHATKEEIRTGYGLMIEAQEQSLSKKYLTWQASLKAVADEADGSGGSKTRGVDIITREKEKIAIINEGEYRNAVDQLEKLKSECQTEENNVGEQVESSFSQNAMLFRIKALFELVLEDPWMMLVYCLVTLFLFFLEFIVVLLKLYLPMTNYEKKIQLIEQIGQKSFDPDLN